MKVTGWTWYDNPDYKDMAPVGGPFPFEDCWCEVKEIIAEEIRKHGYKFTGDYHQNGDFGAPIIDNEWLFMTSQRAWGHMMVRAYPEEIDNSDGYGYVKWAWIPPDGEKMVVPNDGIVDLLEGLDD